MKKAVHGVQSGGMSQKQKGKGNMVRFRTRLVAVTCAVAMVGSFWGSAGAIVSVGAAESSAETAWSITTDTFVFDTAADAKWTDKVYASNDSGTYPELGRIDDLSVGKKAVLTANVTLDGDFSGLDGAQADDGTYNAIQLSCAIKTGDGWTYVKSDDYPFLKTDNFTDGKTQVSFAFDIEDTGAVSEIIFQYNSNSAYAGKIEISDVEIQSDASGEEPGTEEPGTEEPGTEEPGTEEPGTEEPGTENPGNGSSSTGNVTGKAAAAVTENTVWSSDEAVLTFDTASDKTWKDKAYASNDSATYADMARIEGATVGEKVKLTATVSLDGDISALDGAEASDGSYNAIQLACAIKTGDSWTYAKSDDYPFLKSENFTDGKCSVEFSFNGVDAGDVQEIIFQYNANSAFTGKVLIGGVAVDKVESGKKPTTTETEAGNFADASLVFDTASDAKWTDKAFASNDTGSYPDLPTIDNVKVGAKAKLTATVTLDADAAGLDGAEAADGSYNAIQLACAMKTGDSWKYNKSGDYPFLKAENFVDGKCDISFTFDVAEVGNVQEIVFQYNSNSAYAGKITISNVKVLDVKESSGGLEQRDPAVISDLSSVEDYGKWSTEAGYAYKHGDASNKAGTATPDISYDSANERLKVSVDYSADSTSSWSEAKVKCVPTEAMDVSQYNQLSVDIIYPAKLKGSKIKFFANGIINKDTTIDDDAEDIGGGMKKATITMGFTPTDKPLTDVTIGIIGCNSNFKGNVYIDNLVLSQADTTKDFVEITETPGAGSPADLSQMPSSVNVSDANAADSARALAAYLNALMNSDQVLFGHQNDVSRSVNPQATLGDVYDVTGQVSGVFGIDSLAVTGSEAGGSDAASALANSVAYSKTAAANGSIISLSMHMPNFSNSKIVKNSDGTYSFYGCDFSESKDLSNDIVKQILPGGEYNEVFTAYLDVIADYASQLQAAGIPIMIRPFHENTGSWFWWGSMNTAETYKSLYRYTKDYMEQNGVHNLLWVYSPNGPLTSEAAYMSYYPGDEYVDILAFDYYNDYNSYPASADNSFFDSLDTTCSIVSSIAAKRGKIPAIAECGVRVMKKDGSDNEGLLVKGNPVGTEASGKNWYQEVSDIAKKNNMPYYLVWANFGDTNFYVPYKYDDTHGQELINDFIKYYNDDSSIFGGDTGFYSNMGTLAGVSANTYTNQMGYMVYPFDRDTILEATTLKAGVKNASKVQFVINNPDTGVKLTLNAEAGAAIAAAGSEPSLYTAELTDKNLSKLGKTDTATITLMADGEQLAQLSNISLGKTKDKAPANVIEDFEYYSGSDGLLDSTYTSNSAAGCSSSFVLDKTHKNGGTYGGAFKYKLETNGSEVWTGRIKSELTSNDFSKYNALEMWVQPDGMGQKLVIQLTDGSGEEFEVYLTDFVMGTKAQYVTIPFSSFKGKKGGTLDTSDIVKFAVWCNSIVPEDHTGKWTVDSTIYFDGIQAVKLTDDMLKKNPVDKNGLIITDKSLVKKDAVDPGKDDPTTEDPTTEDPSTEDPTTENPTTETPTTDDPTTEAPGKDDKTTEATTAATTDGSTDGKGQNVVNTGDKSPVDTMFAIMIASLIMAGAGYIVIKKDKK